MNIGLTALTEFWGDSPDLILTGEWCKNNNIDIQSSSRNITIHPYPWDNRNKLYSSYLYTNSVYKSFLPIIADTLNTYHSEKNSTHYWEIIIGPWLKYFIQTLFDKYTVIKEISDGYDNLECEVIEDIQFVPIDFDDYFENSTISHYYNQLIFSQILQKLDTSIKIKSKKVSNKNIGANQNNLVTSLKNIIITYFLSKLNILGSKKTFIHKTGLNLTKELMLAFSYKTLPRYYIKYRADIKVVKDLSFRQDEHIKVNSDEFCTLLSSLVFKNMPSSYLESYGDTISCVKKNLTSMPRVIVTSNTLISDEYIKAMVAYSTEKGSKLVIHQHGGHYGTGKFLPLEDHEVSISDLFLSWGWEDVTRLNVKPFYCTKNYSSNKFKSDTTKILVIATSSPLYTKYFYSAPLSSQVIDCSNSLIKVIEALPYKVRERIIYRIKNEHGWNLSDRIISKYKEVKIENSSEDYLKSMKSSSLIISTYNATVFLESFKMGIPTLLFWDANHQEIRDDAVKYYDELERVGILYHDPIALAKKINEISVDTYSWWCQEEVVKAVTFFCNYFVKQTSNIRAEHKSLTIDLFN